MGDDLVRIGIDDDHLVGGLDVQVNPVGGGIIDHQFGGAGNGNLADRLVGGGINGPEVRAVVVRGIDAAVLGHEQEGVQLAFQFHPGQLLEVGGVEHDHRLFALRAAVVAIGLGIDDGMHHRAELEPGDELVRVQVDEVGGIVLLVRRQQAVMNGVDLQKVELAGGRANFNDGAGHEHRLGRGGQGARRRQGQQ